MLSEIKKHAAVMKNLLTIPVLMLLLTGISCKKENTTVPAEPVKALDGNWKIIKALRNGTDLTERFNFSAFRIQFADSAYTITNPVPFIVSKSGTWSFDDPEYPFTMSFSAPGNTRVSTAIQYPVVKGVRNIVISFSPGCTSNTYQYTLQQAD
jgi:hypothetical protein